MRRFLAFALVVALIALGVPTASFAAARQAPGSISGIAKDAGGVPLPNYTVRLRNVTTGQVAATTTTNGAGEFSFTNVNPGNYIIEIVDSNGKVVATSTTLSLAAGATLTGVAVSMSAAGAAAASGAAGGAGSFFTSTTGILILAAAGGGTVAAIVATRGDSSPSK